MNHRSGNGKPNAAAAASSADVLEAQNEAMLTNLQSKISTLKNVMPVFFSVCAVQRLFAFR